MPYNVDKQAEKVKILYPQADDTTVRLQLEFARNFINDRRGFIPTDDMPVEDKYLDLQVLLTVEALSKQGAEGEKSHSDNGVSRGYENGSPYSDSLANRIIPLGTSYKS